MEENLSWEADSFSASQEISCILWYPQVYFNSDSYTQLHGTASSFWFYPSSNFLREYSVLEDGFASKMPHSVKD
jgi:hypothetical protein